MNRLSNTLKTSLGSTRLGVSYASWLVGASTVAGVALASSVVIGTLPTRTSTIEKASWPLSALRALAPQPALAQSASTNPEIKVGIVQRFGENKTDKITLAPLAGDQITVAFKTGGQEQTVTTNRLQIDITMQPLETPVLEERVVLSDHRSFESAEDSAIRWRAAGIDAEIAQPESWQVWAKREDYNSPIVRRLLLRNLHAAGYTSAFIESEVVREVPKAAFIANGYKYARDEFIITTANRRFQMAQGNSIRYRDIYAGDLKIQPNSYGNYTLVNQVPIDVYLRGVVPHEIGPSAPRNAIQAQAILARTYALRNLRRFAIDDYELCADTQCQVYFGLADTDPVSDQAIAATSGQVLTYDNELVDALYSSTTGGITARFTDVWNGEDRPYLRPVIDSLQSKWDLDARPLSDEANFRAFIALNSGFNEDGWPAFRWDRKASLQDIGTTMKEYLSRRQHPLAGFNQITGLTVVERAPSGRVQKLTVDTDIGSFDLIKDESVKALIPPRSLLFYLEPIMEEVSTTADNTTGNMAGTAVPANVENAATPNNNSTDSNKQQTPPPAQPVLTGYRFIGGGFGHGVGMSQTGAYNLGKQGYSSEQILEFYYPGTELKPISESTIFYDAD
ncbi:MAG: SpoIID/LytB domain-containing protein [Cyanobacteria bacterium J06635_11]